MNWSTFGLSVALRESFAMEVANVCLIVGSFSFANIV